MKIRFWLAGLRYDFRDWWDFGRTSPWRHLKKLYHHLWYLRDKQVHFWRYVPDPEIEKRIQELCRALEAGNYDAAPTKLTQGCELKIENLSVVMQCVTYTGPRPMPRRWEVWKRWNPRYMRELREHNEEYGLKLGRIE